MLILNDCQIPPFLISPFFTVLLKQTASNSWALYDKVVISTDSRQQIYWPLRCTETIFSFIWQARYFIKTVFQQFWITAATPFCQKQTEDIFHQRQGNRTQHCSISWTGEHQSCGVKNGSKKKKAGFQTVMINFSIIELESEGVFLAEKLTNMGNCWYSTFSEHPNEWASCFEDWKQFGWTWRFLCSKSTKPRRNCISTVDSDALQKIDKGEWLNELSNVKKVLKLNVKRGIKTRLVR